jgi:uncharacterized membrane protein YhhN
MKPVPDPAQKAALGWMHLLMLASAALAILSSVMGLLPVHFVCKPLTMLLAIGLVYLRASQTRAMERFDLLLIAALAASMAGDVLLMLPGGYFVPGLAAFLLAHLFYIALFRQGIAWFPSRRALLLAPAVGAAMYVWVWSGLTDPILKVAVAAYVSVISLMVAQAIGRATVLRDTASKAVALGACVFMLSDSLIAINRFVQPLPTVSLWVLTTYYAAQILLVRNSRRPDAG